MGDLIGMVVKGAVLIAAIAMLLVFGITYWYVILGFAIVVWVVLSFISKVKDEGDKSLMQLKIKRTMEMKGMLSAKPVFGINFRADYSPEEKEDINKFNLGGEMIYQTEKLRVTIKSLQNGHYTECPDLETLLKAKNAVRAACEGLKSYLEVAKTFNGQDVVFEY